MTYVPIFAVRRQLTAGGLVAVLERHVRDVGVFRMLWPSGRAETPRLRAFVDFMSQHLFSDLTGE